MTSSFMRNLPVIVLAVCIAVAVYMLYRNMNQLESRVDGLSRDLLMTIQNLQLVMQPQACPIQQEKPAQSVMPGTTSRTQPRVIIGEDELFGEEAESMAPEDIEVTTCPRQTAPAKPLQKQSEKQVNKTAEESKPTQVETYIGQLERYLEAEEPAMDDPNADDAESARSRAGAEASEGSESAGQLNSRKRVPPWPAKNHEVGHEEEWNGKWYKVIRNSKMLSGGRVQARPHRLKWSHSFDHCCVYFDCFERR